MKAIGYIRVSTQEQATEGVSLEMQRAKIEAWSSLNDCSLEGVYMDEGQSGAKTDREGLRDALCAVKQHKQGVLVVYSLSRLSRSTLQTLTISENLEKAGCDLVSLQENIDTTSSTGRLTFRLFAVLAEFERELLSERTREALSHKKSQGYRTGSVPHGYRVTAGNKLIPLQKEQKIIRLVSELRSQGLSLRQISGELESRGVFNRNGKPYNPKSVNSMLRAA